MKLVLFSRYPRDFNKPKGGVEAVTVVLARALSEVKNLDVHLITLEKGMQREENDRDGKVSIHRLPGSSFPQIVDIMCGPGRKRLLRKIYDLAPDIVHSHETFGLNLTKIMVPHVFTLHGFDHANLVAEGAKLATIRSKAWEIVENYCLANQREMISISPYVSAMIMPKTKARIHDIDNPVDNCFFKIKREEASGRVLCVGWLNERKNTLGSIRAFASSIEQGCKGKLIIAGEGRVSSYMEAVKAEINKRDIGKEVEMIGHVGHDRLKKEVARASVLLLPSLQENAPMAISEAMAVGVPVITSNRCGMPYMVEDGKSGFLIDPLNGKQIADRLVLLLKSRELREKFGKRSIEIAEARFKPEVVALKTLNVYNSVINIKN